MGFFVFGVTGVTGVTGSTQSPAIVPSKSPDPAGTFQNHSSRDQIQGETVRTVCFKLSTILTKLE